MKGAQPGSPRSYLFVPGCRPDRFDKAMAAGADRVVLDLEDAVPPSEKSSARAAVATYLSTVDGIQRSHLVVRINDVSTAWFDRDLSMLASSGALTVMLPKAEQTDTVAHLRKACPGIAVLALVESARGVLNAEALAAAPGVKRLVFGTLDFALDLDLSGDPVGLDYAASRLALASRAAGIEAPVAGVTTDIDNEDVLRTEFARARAHGFNAKLCIHPRQVAHIHAALPSAAELDWATRVIATMQGNPAAAQVDGRMVDKPVLQRAQALLARAQAH